MPHHADTKRERAEALLRESQERYRNLAECTTDMIYIAARNGEILYANQSAAKALRRDPRSIVGMPQEELFSPEIAQRHKETIMAVFQTGEVSHSDGIYRFGPQEVWLHTCLVPLRDEEGQITSVMGVSRNITDRKRAEEALQKARDELEQRVADRTAELTKANEELQAVYDGMVDGLHILDLETVRAMRINSALCRMMGYTAEEAMNLSQADAHPPEDLPRIVESFRMHLARGDASWTEDLPLMRKDGSVFYAETTGIRVLYDGRPSLMCFFRDITERRRAHEALKREHHTLKHLLQSSDHERQLIAYEIHDGLAQQLAGAMMQFQTFCHLKDNQPGLAAKAFDAGMTMLQQSHFETRRLIAGVRPPILDESGVVAAVSHLVNEQCRIHGMHIEFRSNVSFDRLAPPLENAIYRIAQEGLTNACQHSESEKIRLVLSQRHDRVRIDIRDWGIGFDPARVGDCCFGLAGIRERARLLDGRCRVRSTPESGTRITVELPLVLREG